MTNKQQTVSTINTDQLNREIKTIEQRMKRLSGNEYAMAQGYLNALLDIKDGMLSDVQ